MFLNILKCLSVNLIVAWGSAIMFVSPKLCLSNRSPGGAISEHKYIEIYKEKYKYNNKFRYRCKFFNDKSQIENKLWHSNRTPVVLRENSMCDWLSNNQIWECWYINRISDKKSPKDPKGLEWVLEGSKCALVT